MQPGQRAPRAADRVERAAAALGQPRHARELLIDHRHRLVDTASRGVDETQAAERHRRRLGEALPGDVDELEAAAAEVGGEAVGVHEAHHDALRRELGFLLAGEHLDVRAAGSSPRVMKSTPSSASRTAAVATARRL